MIPFGGFHFSVSGDLNLNKSFVEKSDGFKPFISTRQTIDDQSGQHLSNQAFNLFSFLLTTF